jgi:tetratricopeptide (TPR) repeat protein
MPKKKEKYFREAVEYYPDDAATHEAYADWLSARGRDTDAHYEYQKAEVLYVEAIREKQSPKRLKTYARFLEGVGRDWEAGELRKRAAEKGKKRSKKKGRSK